MWFILAIVGSLFGAFFMEVNRHFKQDGIRLNMWRALVQSLIFATFLFLFPWPDDPVFYYVGFLGGLVIALIDSFVWNVAAKHNGRVASMMSPLRALTPFLLWFLIMPASFWELWARPWDFAFVMLGMALMIGGGVAIRKNKLAWDTFKPLMVVGVLNGVMLVVRRLSIDISDVFIQMMQLFFLHYMTVFILTAMFVAMRHGRTGFVVSGGMFKAAVLIGLGIMISAQLLNVSVALAPNAGYPPAIFLLMPIWLMLYHKLRGIQDNASPYAAAVVVAGVILMLVAAA